MWRYLGKRLLISIGTILGIVVIVFFIVRVLPGDAAVVRAGPYASPETIQEIRDRYGLSDPIGQQFVTYLSDLARGDMGTSIRTDQPVTGEVLQRLPASLELAFYAVLMAILIGVPIGIAAAARPETWVDRTTRVFAVLGSSMALFWLGLLLIYFLFTASGGSGPSSSSGCNHNSTRADHRLLHRRCGPEGSVRCDARGVSLSRSPGTHVVSVLAAPILKMVLASMRRTLASDDVRTARSLGIPRRQIICKNGFRNALIPVTTAIGIVFGYMLGGNIIVEFLFSWPGVGRDAYSAIQNNDLEALQGFVIMVGILHVGLNVIIDLLYAWIDPRIRLGGSWRRDRAVPNICWR